MASNNDTIKKCFSITWVLENFPYFGHKTGEKIMSPAFVVNTMENSKWRLIVYPRGGYDKKCMSFHLFREGDSKGPACMKIDFELSFLDADGSPVIVSNGTDCSFLKGNEIGWHDICKRNEAIVKKGVLQNNLTLRCRMWKTTGKVLENGMCFIRTRMGVEQKTYVWKIDKHLDKSVRMRCASNDKHIMTLELFWLDDTLGGNFGTFCMNCRPYDPEISLFTLKLMVLDAKGRILECVQDELWSDSSYRSKHLQIPISKSKLMSQNLYVPKGVLTVQFKCNFPNKVVFEKIEKISYGPDIRDAIPEDQKRSSIGSTVPDTISALKTDLSALFNDRNFCDVKVNTKTESFHAHWLLLSARSPVFRAMYSTDMKEKAKSCITILDIDADTVLQMLRYIYTDSLEHLSLDNASLLYVAADKYAILSLKDKCSTFLKDNLCQSNACAVLVLADRHSDDNLKSYVQDFILKHDQDIIKSPKWKALMKTNAKLAAETMFLKYTE